MNPTTVVNHYLEIVKETRSDKTYVMYRSALHSFLEIVEGKPITLESYIHFLRETGEMEPATQSLYRAALHGLYTHLAASDPSINLAAMKDADKRYARRRGRRLPTFDQKAVERVIDQSYAMRIGLVGLRNYAFIRTLADTGLRISEACALTRGSVDMDNRKSIIIGKGDNQAVIRYTDQSIRAIRDYLSARSKMDGESGKPLSSLPLFARHDRGAGIKVKPVEPGGMWRAIKSIAKSVDADHIRVHDFRHYFVSMFYERSGGDLKATQEVARHANIGMTEKYTHLSGDLDQLFRDVMEAK